MSVHADHWIRRMALGLAQVLFLAAAELCETSYADRAGKYQAQRGITAPRM